MTPGDDHADLISVLMPVYNAGAYLAQAVESVLSQTYRRFELIAVNDGSTDGSLGVLRQYAERDGRVRLVSRPNTGYSVALNEALGLAEGSLLARMDADDVAAPERLERQAAYLAAHPDCVAVGCRVLLVDGAGEPLIEPVVETDHEGISRELFKGHGGVIPHPGLMARASAVRALGGYRVDFEPAEDLDLYLRLAEVGRLANLPEILLKYRQHHRSVSYRRLEEQQRRATAAVAEALARRGDPVGPDFALPGWVHPIAPEQCKAWFWRALEHGRRSAARRYAVRLLKDQPFSPETWRMVYCAVRGH
jgi:glycosyltransferase involved in cell wall biosynthesis